MKTPVLVVAVGVVLASVGLAQAQQSSPPAPAPTLDDAGTAVRGAATQRRGGGGALETRQFLGLGVAPDAAAAARGKPAYAENCAACHGAEGRGGIGPNLLYSTQVLDDDHGEKLAAFLAVGRPDKGMPGFATLGKKTLTDIAEFLHLQVENYANRGTYQNTNNVMTGNATKGAAYLAANCTTCHSATGDLKGVGARFRPLDLQRAMIFPPRDGKPTRAVQAVVTTPTGTVSGEVTRIDDFEIVLRAADGTVHPFRRTAGVKVALKDPLQWHRDFAYRLKDADMTDLVTYLGSLK